jgi:hypothetical protein
MNAPKDTLGVSFAAGGPAIGPVPLLRLDDGVFSVRPVEDLTYVLGLAFDEGVRIARFVPALEGVARALNAGDLGQAMLRVQLMNLPVLPDQDAFERAVEAEDLLKASPDDPLHPGYPKGEPNGRGGQYRPKGALAGEVAEHAVEKRLQRLIARRAFRTTLRRVITPRAVLRAGAELLSNADPIGPAEVGDALAVEQAAEIAAQIKEVGQEAEAALDFVKQGPRELEDLYASKKPDAFDSFDAFKKTDDADAADLEKQFGEAGDGYDYHHIVEQAANGRRLTLRELNSTTNIIKIPRLLHEEINVEYATKRDINGVYQSLRQSLQGKSFEEQREAGIAVLRKLGIIE